MHIESMYIFIKFGENFCKVIMKHIVIVVHVFQNTERLKKKSKFIMSSICSKSIIYQNQNEKTSLRLYLFFTLNFCYLFVVVCLFIESIDTCFGDKVYTV